jgi:hypothetical protein
MLTMGIGHTKKESKETTNAATARPDVLDVGEGDWG